MLLAIQRVVVMTAFASQNGFYVFSERSEGTMRRSSTFAPVEAPKSCPIKLGGKTFMYLSSHIGNGGRGQTRCRKANMKVRRSLL